MKLDQPQESAQGCPACTLHAMKSTVAVQPRSILISAKDGGQRHVPVALFREIETYFIGSPAQSPRHRLRYSRSPRHLPTTLLP